MTLELDVDGQIRRASQVWAWRRTNDAWKPNYHVHSGDSLIMDLAFQDINKYRQRGWAGLMFHR